MVFTPDQKRSKKPINKLRSEIAGLKQAIKDYEKRANPKKQRLVLLKGLLFNARADYRLALATIKRKDQSHLAIASGG